MLLSPTTTGELRHEPQPPDNLAFCFALPSTFEPWAASSTSTTSTHRTHHRRRSLSPSSLARSAACPSSPAHQPLRPPPVTRPSPSSTRSAAPCAFLEFPPLSTSNRPSYSSSVRVAYPHTYQYPLTLPLAIEHASPCPPMQTQAQALKRGPEDHWQGTATGRPSSGPPRLRGGSTTSVK